MPGVVNPHWGASSVAWLMAIHTQSFCLWIDLFVQGLAHTLSRVQASRNSSSSPKSVEGFQPSLAFGSRGLFLPLAFTPFSRVRGCRNSFSSQRSVEDLQSSLALCSRGPFLPHPLAPF